MFRLWDGSEWRPHAHAEEEDKVRFTITLNHPGSLRKMFFPPSDTRLSMAYTLGDFEIDGDVYGALDLGRHLWESWGFFDTIMNAYKLIRLPNSH